MKGIIHRNSLGWEMVSRDKVLLVFEPETTLGRILRFFPAWGPFVLMAPMIFREVWTLWILICLSGTLGLLFSRRDIWPTLSVTKDACSFGLAFKFSAEHAVILFAGDNPSLIIVVDGRNGRGREVWRCDSREDGERVVSALSAFIHRTGVVKAGTASGSSGKASSPVNCK